MDKTANRLNEIHYRRMQLADTIWKYMVAYVPINPEWITEYHNLLDERKVIEEQIRHRKIAEALK